MCTDENDEDVEDAEREENENAEDDGYFIETLEEIVDIKCSLYVS